MLSEPTRGLLGTYRTYIDKRASSENLPKIHVDEIAAKVAAFYEKIRNIVDFQEDHLLRKRFIDRTFRRRFLFSVLDPDIAEGLVKETVRAGHLPNDSVPEEKIAEVRDIINFGKKIGAEIKDDGLYDWFFEITICEIEDALFPADKKKMVADLMFFSLRDSLAIKNIHISEKEIDLQLFSAVQKALFRLDQNQLNYRLLNFIYPSWRREAESGEEIISKLKTAKIAIEEGRKSPAGEEFMKLCNRFNTVFYLIGDLLEENRTPEELEDIFASDEKRDKEISRLYRARYGREKQRLNRLAFLTVISFFITKIAIALAVEIPIDKYLGSFSWKITAANIILPPFIMILILAAVHMPSSNNLKLILEETRKVASSEEKRAYSVIFSRPKKFLTRAFVWIFYAATVVAIFYGTVLLLRHFGFSPANTVVFLIFTSLVAAVGVRINNRAKELSLEKERTTFFSFLVDVISMPFVSVGKTVLIGLGKFNVFAIVANFFVELPFQIFVEFLENFSSFIKNRKEKIN